MIDENKFFERHHDRIYRYVLHLVRNSAQAEDLTQETFLRAYRNQESLREPGAAVGWLYRIATNICLDHLRQRKPQVSLEAEGITNQVESIAGAGPSALQEAERKETSECVQQCLKFLPDKYRAMLLLHEVYSLTAPQIATLLSLNLTTVKMRLHRAHCMLEMVMQCGCAVSNDACGLPVCEPKSGAATRLGKN